jgi:hypothetical protein
LDQFCGFASFVPSMMITTSGAKLVLASKLAWSQYGLSPLLSSVAPLTPKFCTVSPLPSATPRTAG